MAANATTAVKGGTFVKRHDCHITRVPMRVDEAGWGELRDLFAKTLEGVFEIQEKAAERLGGSDDAGIPVIAFNTFFEMPERKKPTD